MNPEWSDTSDSYDDENGPRRVDERADDAAWAASVPSSAGGGDFGGGGSTALDEARAEVDAVSDAGLDRRNREVVEAAQQGRIEVAPSVAEVDDAAWAASVPSAGGGGDFGGGGSEGLDEARAEVDAVSDAGLDRRNREVVEAAQQGRVEVAPSVAELDDAAWAASTPHEAASEVPVIRPVDAVDAQSRTSANRIDLADDVPEIALKPTYDGYLDLVIHGDATHTQADILGDRRDLDLRETADLIRDSPNWQDRPIRLLSCSTGADRFAADLATTLRVPVYAPTTDISVYGDGSIRLEDGGRWRRFEPRWYD